MWYYIYMSRHSKQTYSKTFSKMLLLGHLKRMRIITRNLRFICFQSKCWKALPSLKSLYHEVKTTEEKIKFKHPFDMDLYRYKRKLELIKQKGLKDGFGERLADKANVVIGAVIENVELRLLKGDRK